MPALAEINPDRSMRENVDRLKDLDSSASCFSMFGIPAPVTQELLGKSTWNPTLCLEAAPVGRTLFGGPC